MSERTECNDNNSSPKRGRVKRSSDHSIDQSQISSEQSVIGNVEVPQKYSKSDHPNGSSPPVLVLEQRVLTRGIESKENKNMTSLGMVSCVHTFCVGLPFFFLVGNFQFLKWNISFLIMRRRHI